MDLEDSRLNIQVYLVKDTMKEHRLPATQLSYKAKHHAVLRLRSSNVVWGA